MRSVHDGSSVDTVVEGLVPRLRARLVSREARDSGRLTAEVRKVEVSFPILTSSKAGSCE